jgi:muramoyltetrapeptide carboxypeptidase
MITPPLLRAGNTVAITAPGRKVSKADMDIAIKTFQSWGLDVKLADNLFSNDHSYLAGTDPQRLDDLQSLINDANVHAIICARGGYGSTRIVDQVDFSPLVETPKFIVGFSDITAIHLKLYSLGIQSIHATMPILFSKDTSRPSIESLKRILMEKPDRIQSPSTKYSIDGRGRGEVIGGNLSLINDALGTSSEPDTNGKILVIEEIDEYRYKIDRMLTQLKRAGKLENLAGLVVGHMTDIKDSELSFGETVEEIILNHTRQYNYPVAFGFPTGHENPNLAWLHGGMAELNVHNGEGTLSFATSESV